MVNLNSVRASQWQKRFGGKRGEEVARNARPNSRRSDQNSDLCPNVKFARVHLKNHLHATPLLLWSPPPLHRRQML